MTYAIEISGLIRGPRRLGLASLLGDDAICERDGRTVLRVTDQPALLGLLNRLNDLGVQIDRVARTGTSE